MNLFGRMKEAKSVEIFALTKTYTADTSDYKVNLSIGAYRTEKGEPWVLPVVKQAEKTITVDDCASKEYLPMLGLDKFYNAAAKLLLGGDSIALFENRVLSMQVLSGTGSLRLAAEFLCRILGYEIFYVSCPTWENHRLVFDHAGFKECRLYRYWHTGLKGFDIEGMLEDLQQAPERSVIILQASGHNPTGCDPTHNDWVRIVDVLRERNLFPLIDCAYQGMVTGEIDKDAWIVRYLVTKKFEFFGCQTFSKTFGLYNERIGNLVCVVKSPEVIHNLKTQFTKLIRSMYSNPPAIGARIVAHILTTPQLCEEWKDSLRKMSTRMVEMRISLRSALEKLETPGSWEHITSQIGMYSYTGMTEQQCLHMIYNFHVYMLRSGRINVCGLNPSNVEYVAKAIHDTIKHVPV